MCGGRRTAAVTCSDWAVHGLRARLLREPCDRSGIVKRLTDVPLNLAAAYGKLGRPCDAILPLAQVVVQHPTVSNIGALQARVEALSTLPQYAWAAGEG